MDQFFKYALAIICGYAFLVYTARLIKLLFNPGFLQHKMFDFPQDKLRKALLLISAMLILLSTVLLKLGYI